MCILYFAITCLFYELINKNIPKMIIFTCYCSRSLTSGVIRIILFIKFIMIDTTVLRIWARCLNCRVLYSYSSSGCYKCHRLCGPDAAAATRCRWRDTSACAMWSILRMQRRPSTLSVLPATRNWRKARHNSHCARRVRLWSLAHLLASFARTCCGSDPIHTSVLCHTPIRMRVIPYVAQFLSKIN